MSTEEKYFGVLRIAHRVFRK